MSCCLLAPSSPPTPSRRIDAKTRASCALLGCIVHCLSPFLSRSLALSTLLSNADYPTEQRAEHRIRGWRVWQREHASERIRDRGAARDAGALPRVRSLALLRRRSIYSFVRSFEAKQCDAAQRRRVARVVERNAKRAQQRAPLRVRHRRDGAPEVPRAPAARVTFQS